MLLEITIQDEEFWEGSDAEINAHIEEIVGQFADAASSQNEPADDTAEALPGAIKHSYNAEEIATTDDRARFVARPVSEIDIDASALGLRRIGNLLSDIEEAVADRPNVLSGLRPAFRPLAREFERSQDAPYLIYHALLGAACRLDLLCNGDDLPTADPDVEDYRQQLRSIALDILVNDAEVKKALDARVDFHRKELTDSDQRAMQQLAQGLAEISTEPLATQMVEDAATATDPGEPDEEAKKNAAFQYGSRTVRMLNLNREAVEDVAAVSGITSFLWGIVNWFAT